MNEQISVLLVDDDEYQLAHLTDLVRRLRPEWRIAGQLSTLTDIVSVLDAVQPSLCIMDVVFPEMTSLAAVRDLDDNCPMIFVTGDPQFAVEAFDCNAIDFIIKPVRVDRLEQALRKAEAILQARKAGMSDGLGSAGARFNSIRFLRGQDLVWSSLKDVSYFQAQRKYTRVVLRDQEGLLRLGLSAVQQHLKPSDFLRIHRGFIVNASHIDAARRDEFGRLVVRVKGREREDRLVVSKPYEHLFRDGFS